MVVELIVSLEQRNQHSVFAILLATVFVEFFEKVFVFVLGSSSFVFVFHLEHDGNNFVAMLIRFAINVITFTTCGLGNGIVFLEISTLESGGAELVKLSFAMLFQAFANHLGRHFGFHILIIGNHFIFATKLGVMLFFE